MNLTEHYSALMIKNSSTQTFVSKSEMFFRNVPWIFSDEADGVAKISDGLDTSYPHNGEGVPNSHNIESDTFGNSGMYCQRT